MEDESRTLKPLRSEFNRTLPLRPRTPEDEQKQQEAEKARQEAIKAGERQKRIAAANLPLRLMEKRNLANKLPASHGWKQRLSFLQSRIEKPGEGCLFALIGGYGCGKSQLGVMLAHAVTESATSLFVYAAELTDSIKDVYRSDAGTVIGQMDKFIKPRLLVIDEVNAGLSEADVKYLQRIVCRRYDDLTDTLLLSNETKADFQAIVGDRITSRMIEAGGIIEADWPSFRKAK